MIKSKKPAGGTKPAKAAKPAIELHVAPHTGKAARAVVARLGEKEFTDTFDPFKASAREKFIGRLADKFHRKEEDLAFVDDLLVQKAKDADALAEQAADEAAVAKVSPAAKALAETPKEVLEAAEAFLENPDLMGELDEDVAALGVAGESLLARTVYVVLTSRLLDTPLSGSTRATSSSGKSFVTGQVVSLLPPEDVIVATDLTPNSLYYLPQGSLKHKAVLVTERRQGGGHDEAAADATLALREMLSRGCLDKFVPVKSPGGGIETKHIHQEGPISFLETTTLQAVFEEDASRMLPLTTDESSEQTAAILARQAKEAAWEAGADDEQERVRQKHRAAQRLLKRLRVRIPYAGKLGLPANSLTARRAFPQLLACIKAVALLRQRQKAVHADGHIDADSRDYRIAYDIMVPVLRRTFAPLSERALKLLGVVRGKAPNGKEFDRADAAKWAGIGTTEARNRLTQLVESGMVEQVTGGKGVRYTYRVVHTRHAKLPALDALITPDTLREAIKKDKKAKKAAKAVKGQKGGKAAAAPQDASDEPPD